MARSSIAPRLSARDVEEALEERISTGKYALGARIPTVRDIADEFGTSPSTVSRALQEMMRSGWLEVHERRFVRVRDQLPANVLRSTDIQHSVKAVAHKWKLRGGTQEELTETLAEIVADVFKSQAKFVFTECNASDLGFMAKQLTTQMPDAQIKRQLIKDLNKQQLLRDGSVILVPYFHYAEVREIVGDAISIVPIHFKPSIEALDKLLYIRPKSNVVVFGHDQRSIDRLSLIVRDYVDVTIQGVTLKDHKKLAKLAKSADAIVAIASAMEALPQRPEAKLIIEVRFELESSLRPRLSGADLSVAPHE